MIPTTFSVRNLSEAEAKDVSIELKSPSNIDQKDVVVDSGLESFTKTQTPPHKITVDFPRLRPKVSIGVTATHPPNTQLQRDLKASNMGIAVAVITSAAALC